jgi:AraC family transcriptional regulator, arabinose operon regulatory protein
MMQKKEGFINQKAIVLPQTIQNELRQNPITKLLFITDIGLYPQARYHYRDRPEGCDQHILIHCIEGKGWVEIDKTRKKVQKDQFLMIPANIPHRYGSESSEPWTIYWLHFTGEVSQKFVENGFVLTSVDPLENTRNERRIRLFDEIYQNLSMGYSTENLEYSSGCLWYLLGAYKYLPQFERIRAVQQHNMIEKSILYMHEHIDGVINLNELATLCGFSPSHYSMVFRKKTSRPPIEYFNNMKIQKACQMLDFTDDPIKVIASRLAFEDQFYFSRVFRKYMGISPVEYRKKKKG